MLAGNIAAGAAALLAYATLIEPFAIHHVEITLLCERLPKAFDGYRVLLLSDFHSRRMAVRERKVLKMIEAIPEHDIIALDGDLIYTPRGMDSMYEFTSRLHAKDGVYGTFGNSEHKNGVVPHVFARGLEKSGVQMLLNKSVRINRGNKSIVIAGVNDPVSEHDDIGAALKGVDEDEFTLLLMHTPDSVGLACARGVDVVLSGHTHGGQVKLPLIGAPFTHSYLGPAMSHGLYSGARLQNILGYRPRRTQLYVTRGIGISGLAMRFLCRPEITTITLKKKRLG